MYAIPNKFAMEFFWKLIIKFYGRIRCINSQDNYKDVPKELLPLNIFSCEATVTKYDDVMGMQSSLKQNTTHRKTLAAPEKYQLEEDRLLVMVLE